MRRIMQSFGLILLSIQASYALVVVWKRIAEPDNIGTHQSVCTLRSVREDMLLFGSSFCGSLAGSKANGLSWADGLFQSLAPPSDWWATSHPSILSLPSLLCCDMSEHHRPDHSEVQMRLLCRSSASLSCRGLLSNGISLECVCKIGNAGWFGESAGRRGNSTSRRSLWRRSIERGRHSSMHCLIRLRRLLYS